MPYPVYRHRVLPALGAVAEEQVVGELRRLESWSISVDLRLMPWDRDAWADCAAVQGAVPYYDCAGGAFLPSPLAYDGVAFLTSAVLAFLGRDGADAGIPVGGVGNPTISASDEIVLVGTIDLAQWADVSTRRPLSIGGSSMLIDAGSDLRLKLPGGVPANDYGYTLQLTGDGQTVIAVENQPPNLHLSDTSTSDGVLLGTGKTSTGWKDFPSDAAAAADKLTVTIPSGTPAGKALVIIVLHVDNPTTQTGTLIIGFGLDGADPRGGDSQTFIVPGNFSGSFTLALNYVTTSVPPADVVVAAMISVTGDHNNFDLLSTDANGDHRISVSFEYT